MDFYEILSYYFYLQVVVLYDVAASGITTNKFKLTACSDSFNMSKSSMTSPMSALRCSTSCHDQCLGFVSWEGMNGKKQCKLVNDVWCLLPDSNLKCGDTNKKMKLYLKTDYSKVSKNSSNENEEILIVNGWLLPRVSDSDGKKWTIIQRRVSADVDFDRDWEDYQNGFGKLSSSFWLGLEKIYYFCSKLCELRFDFKAEGKDYWVSYKVSFTGADDNYRIDIKADSFKGNVNDWFKFSNGKQFSIKDIDDGGRYPFCLPGFWWYKGCSYVNFNGMWGTLHWYSMNSRNNPVTFSEMKIRPL